MAQIKVNKERWDAVSAQDQEEILAALQTSGALASDDTIIGDASVQALDINEMVEIMAGNPACEAACTASYASATRICNALPHPAARAVCYAAAMAAYAVCLRNC